MSKYNLDILTNKRAYLQHYLYGKQTIGVFDQEPFSLQFTNHTGKYLQLKVSIDGTNLLTKDKANLKVDELMYLVCPWGQIQISEFLDQEKLIFSHQKYSHFHGDQTMNNIISVAIFIEKYEYQRLEFTDNSFSSLYENYQQEIILSSPEDKSAKNSNKLFYPLLTEIIQISYYWWDELRDAMKNYVNPKIVRNGFFYPEETNDVQEMNLERLSK